MAIDIHKRYSTYPKVLIPNNIKKNFNKDYSDIEICKELNIEYPTLSKLRLPPEPMRIISIRQEKTKLQFKDGCMTILAIPFFIFCVVGIFFLISSNIFWPVPIFIIFLYILYENYGFEVKSYTEYVNQTIKEDDFNEMMEEYKSEFLSITKRNNESELEYNEKMKEIKVIISKKYKSVGKSIFFKEFKPKSDFKINSCNNKRGRSESFFLTKLYDKFGSSIRTDVILNNNSLYCPDFVIIDNETNFHIDIEIDEPYAVENGIPIHHDRSNDELRNSFFEKINWGVIRFTEKQIIKNPDECCELISQVLQKIKEKKNIVNHNIEIEDEWSYEEALIMKENDFRNSYLPDNMKIKVVYIKKSNFIDYDDDYYMDYYPSS